MKILIVTPGWRTHFYMVAPLAWALRVSGHEVRVSSPPSGTAAILQAGLPAVALGPELDFMGIRQRAAQHEDPLHERPDTYESLDRKLDDSHAAEILSAWYGVAFSATDDIIAFAREWGPDLIISDALCAGGLAAAHVVGVPAVRVLTTVDVLGSVDGEVLFSLPGYPEQFAAHDVVINGDPAEVTVNPFPPSVLPAPTASRREMRFVPYNGPARMPAWLLERPTRPRVCLTWGTSSNWFADSGRFLVPDVIRALATEDLEVVVTVGPEQRKLVGEVPDGVRLVENMPLHLLLPGSDLLIHQGGGSTMMTAAAAGVPQFVLPYLSEQIDVAQAIAGSGAGAAVGVDDADAPAVREHVAKLLADQSCREAAERLRQEILAQPSPLDTARMLAGLVGSV